MDYKKNMGQKNNPVSMVSKPVGVAKTSLIDTFLIKSSEFGVDSASALINFNGTFKSGFSKIGASLIVDWGARKFLGSNKLVNSINSGLMADGMTDIYVRGRKVMKAGNLFG